MKGGYRENSGAKPRGAVGSDGRTLRRRISMYIDDDERDFLRWVLQAVRQMDGTDEYGLEISRGMSRTVSSLISHYSKYRENMAIMGEEKERADKEPS